SSGVIDRVPLSALAPKSLFLTRPSMMQYTATREELLETAGELFANVASGVLKVRVTKTYPLAEAAKAHTDLEVGYAGNPMGSYTEEQILPASFVVPVPSTIYPIVGAAIMLKGAIDRVPLSALAPKSLFLTRPSMMQYTATREELLETAGELFANVASGVLKVRVTKTYPL
ncbi:hypothetical protein KI387_001186, partial [Taxus chinensis]